MGIGARRMGEGETWRRENGKRRTCEGENWRRENGERVRIVEIGELDLNLGDEEILYCCFIDVGLYSFGSTESIGFDFG